MLTKVVAGRKPCNNLFFLHGLSKKGLAIVKKLCFFLTLIFSLTFFVFASAEGTPSYAEYQKLHETVLPAQENIEIDLTKCYSDNGSPIRPLENGNLPSDENGALHFRLQIPKAALFQVEIEYLPGKGSGSDIQRSLHINGTLPFKEAEGLVFSRLWQDKTPPKAKGETIRGNQSFPQQIECPAFRKIAIHDPLGYESRPFLISLKEGENILSLLPLQEAMFIKSITLLAPQKYPSYAEYIKRAEESGLQKADIQPVKFQAENAHTKSSPSFYPLNDRSSPLSEPYHPSYIVLNTIGGVAWNAPGEWISWEFDAPSEGLYRIALRYKQSAMRGMYVTRKILINDVIPFAEAEELRFYHASGFQYTALGSNMNVNPNGEDFWFHLKKGKNRITMEVSLGELGSVLNDIDALTITMNEIYRSIIAITGTDPDVNRNYQLLNRIPGLENDLKTLNISLKEVYARLTRLTGGTSQRTASLTRLIAVMDKLDLGEENIVKHLSSFKEGITGLGKSTLDFKDQPLTLDYFLLLGKDDPKLKINGNILDNAAHAIAAFIGSFTNDYNSVENEREEKKEKEINVWVGLGRDQFQVIRRLINESFTPKTGVKVNLKLISPDVLLPATMTGTGPDVAIQIGSNAPINFAFRDAALDLRVFSDFEEIRQRFHPSALIGLQYQGGCFALPDQMSFPVLFYRKDILESLRLKVPQTWDDLINVIPELQKENMTIYLDTAPPLTLGVGVSLGSSRPINTVFLSRLFQLGGKIYSEDGTHSLLDSEQANAAFRWWTQFYTQYGFMRDIDFITRFRLGEVPIGMVDLHAYNTLAVSAPEIRNLWGIAPVPGSLKTDGSIASAAPCVIGASMIIKNMVEKNRTALESWEFLKWWTSAETQLSYAREMEAILGPAGRYLVANLEAFHQVSWPSHVKPVLDGILASLKGIPEIPGGYITGRYINNAFLSVITQYENPSDMLFENVQLINDEITLKREEFGLVTKTDEGGK